MRFLCGVVVIMLLFNNPVFPQSKFESLMATNNVPENVVATLKDFLKGQNLDKCVTEVFRPVSKKRIKYGFKFSNVTDPIELSQIVITADGTIGMKMYRYENTGNLPLEILVRMQEKCGSDDVDRLAKIELRTRTMYQAVCGDTVYSFNESYSYIESYDFINGKKFAFN